MIVVWQGGKTERINTLDLGFPVALDQDIADFVDHVNLELQPRDGVVMYTDLRSFTALSEDMTPQQNFNFINAYLSRADLIK